MFQTLSRTKRGIMTRVLYFPDNFFMFVAFVGPLDKRGKQSGSRSIDCEESVCSPKCDSARDGSS